MIKLKDYKSREALENYIVLTYGKTLDVKNDVIKDTIDNLKKFNLKHGGRIWGVAVEASDYSQRVTKNSKSRGEIQPSIINGLIKSKNANNKDQDR